MAGLDLSTGVFEREGQDTLSDRAFYFVLGLCIIWGLGATAYIASVVAKSGYQPDITAILVLGLAIPIAGICIAIFSSNPLISFVGYNMVCVPFGIILAPVLNHYAPNVIQNAFMATCCVTVIMMCLSTMYPAFFAQLGGILFSVLIGLIIVRFMQVFIPGMRGFGWIDWISAALFSLYIGYDWYRASEVPRTLDNAVDIAVSLYLDIVNLFLTLLQIYGERDK